MELEEFLADFERISLDDEAFFTLDNEEDLKVCIKFTRPIQAGVTDISWTFWFELSPQNSQHTVSSKHVSQVLQFFKLKESDFRNELKNILLTQAGFAAYFIQEVEKLCGKKEVAQSIEQCQAFMQNLCSSLFQVLGKTFQPLPHEVVENNRACIRIIHGSQKNSET